MTAKELSRIKKLRIEIDILTEKLSYATLGDTVKGSDKEDPFVLHTVKISGLSKEGIKTKSTIEWKKKELKRLMKYIYGIKDSWTQTMFFLKFDKGLTYKQVAIRMGISEDCVSQTIFRYLQKN